MKTWVVVGGGFQGIVASALLLRRGKSVILIEKAPFLGAVLSSHEQDGLFLDNGCHLFSNQDADTTELCLELMQNHFHVVDVRYASVTDGHQSDEIAVADFSHLAPLEHACILYEVAKAKGTTEDDNFAALLTARYGPTLAQHIRTPVKKMTLREPEQLAANTLNKSPFGRVSVTGQGFGNMLKSFDAFDRALAVPSQKDPMRFYRDAARGHSFRNFYPAEKGTKGFCLGAEQYLRDAGVDIRLKCSIVALSESRDGLVARTDHGQNIDAEGLIWALDPGQLAQILWGDDPLQTFAVRVPMVLYYFLVPADIVPGYTYIHDFSPETYAFRLSSPGFYGRQKNAAGLSYLCAEVPTMMGSEIWQTPEKIQDVLWRQMTDRGMTTLENPAAVIIRKTPISYPLNSPGYAAEHAAVTARIGREYSRIALADPNMFGKVSIVRSLVERIGEAVA